MVVTPAGGATGAATDRPSVSVILCTYNPRPDLFAEVLEALARQTLPASEWELLIIDNNSNPAATLPPLSPSPVTRGEGSAQRSTPSADAPSSSRAAGVSPALSSLNIRIIPEPNPGLNHARRAGIENARADLLVFVDDDNILDADYLETALKLADADPTLGAYGGLCRPRLERPHLPKWKLRLLDKLGVRDNGPTPLTSSTDKWGPWEPIGAGLVLRRKVAAYFLHLMATSPYAPRLDRSGPTGLMSGGDTLMARSAYRVGLACSYQPALKLTHVLKAARFDFKYLVRILHAHGKSVVVLNRALSVPVPRMTLPGLILRFPYRLLTRGIPGCIIYAWDLGYYREARRAD